MAILPDGRERPHLPPHYEALELRDVGAADLTPTLGSAITWDDVDRMWAQEMERRDRLAACPAGTETPRARLAAQRSTCQSVKAATCCARSASGMAGRLLPRTMTIRARPLGARCTRTTRGPSRGYR